MTNNGEALIRQNSPQASSAGPGQQQDPILELGNSLDQQHEQHDHDHDDEVGNNDNNNDGGVADHNELPVPFNPARASFEALVAGSVPEFDELTPSSSQGSYESRFPYSQGSDFFAAASPTYSASLPCLSQPSQDSCDMEQHPLYTLENQCPVDLSEFIQQNNESYESELNLSGGGDAHSESSSQPEAKRMRFDER